MPTAVYGHITLPLDYPTSITIFKQISQKFDCGTLGSNMRDREQLNLIDVFYPKCR